MARQITGSGKQSDSDFTQKNRRKLVGKNARNASYKARKAAETRYDNNTWHNMSYTDKEIRKRNHETGKKIKWTPNGIEVVE